MTAEEFIDTDLFQRYSLSSRLEELRNMPFDAFVFDGEDYGAYQQINLVKITFGVTQEYIDNETERIIQSRYEHVLANLKTNKDALEKIARVLLEKEVIEEAEFKQLADDNTGKEN